VVVLSGLTKHFGQTEALAGLSCELREGEVVGLLGPNGAGKTTTLKLLLGMLRPTSGTASVLGLDCTTQSREVKERIGYTPDEPAFYNFLTGRETLDFVREVRGLDHDRTWAGLDGAIAALQFGDQLDLLVSGYSHGMKKKLAILAALAHGPRVLLLDEPTNGLDPPTAATVRSLFRGLASEHGTAVLLSTHLLDMAERLCDRLLLLDHGRLIASGSAAEVRAQAGFGPESSLEDAFLALVTPGAVAHASS
jgi:ABC-2 type transport system ATP-binding protein